MAEEIYVPSVSHFQVKTFSHKVQHVKPIIVTNTPNSILDRQKNVTICCYLIHTSGIVFLNTIYQQILFATGNMINNRKVKKIDYGIKQVNKL